MASIMTNADLAIGSGGVNTWERMCLSIPSMIISFAKNQVIILQDLVKHGLVEHLGDISEIILAIISNGLGMLDVDTQWQLVINGIIIIAAVAFDELKRKKIWCIILQKEEIINVKSK